MYVLLTGEKKKEIRLRIDAPPSSPAHAIAKQLISPFRIVPKNFLIGVSLCQNNFSNETINLTKFRLHRSGGFAAAIEICSRWPHMVTRDVLRFFFFFFWGGGGEATFSC